MASLTPDQERQARELLVAQGAAPADIDRAIQDMRDGKPCAPCGDAKEVEIQHEEVSPSGGIRMVEGPEGHPGPSGLSRAQDKPPYWILMREALQRDECEDIIRLAKEIGFDQGTIVTGEKVRNSTVAWLRHLDYLQRIRDIADGIAPALRLHIDSSLLESLQIGHYAAENEDYKWHVDHDPTRRNLKHDRKLSLVAALTDGGCLEISGDGRIALNAGDMLAFPGIVSHQAPPMKHERYTLVAWIPGPAWK